MPPPLLGLLFLVFATWFRADETAEPRTWQRRIKHWLTPPRFAAGRVDTWSEDPAERMSQVRESANSYSAPMMWWGGIAMVLGGIVYEAARLM